MARAPRCPTGVGACRQRPRSGARNALRGTDDYVVIVDTGSGRSAPRGSSYPHIETTGHRRWVQPLFSGSSGILGRAPHEAGRGPGDRRGRVRGVERQTCRSGRSSHGTATRRPGTAGTLVIAVDWLLLAGRTQAAELLATLAGARRRRRARPRSSSTPSTSCTRLVARTSGYAGGLRGAAAPRRARRRRRRATDATDADAFAARGRRRSCPTSPSTCAPRASRGSAAEGRD